MRRMAWIVGCVAILACDSEGGALVDGLAEADAGVDADAPVDAGLTCLSTCDMPVVCPSPQAGRVSICGRAYDVATSLPLDDGCATNGEPHLDVKVVFHDAVAYVADPTVAPLHQVSLDACGRFVGDSFPRPTTGVLLVIADDDDGHPDDRVATGIILSMEPGQVRPHVPVFFTPRTTDAAWTATAGDPFAGEAAATFGAKGVVLPIFLDQYASHESHAFPLPGAPVAGVTVTVGGDPVPDSDYYLADTDPRRREVVDPALAATGANGAALVVGSPLAMHSGTGGEPPGCTWASIGAVAVPGLVFVAPRRLECP